MGQQAAASIRQVARAARVSVGTVSNVLNRPSVVAPATRRRVLAAIDELGFVRNESARQLRQGTARTIGLVVLDVGNPFFTDLAKGVEAAATEAGHAVMLCNSDGSRDRESRHLELLAQQQVHGVLMSPVEDDLSSARELAARGVSVVLVGHPAESDDLCSVAVDDRVGGEIAVTHLLATGRRRLTMIAGSPATRQCAERHAGGQQALRNAGHDPGGLEFLEVPTLDVAAGQRAAEQLLARGSLPDGVFCVNDLVALGLLQVLLRAGVSVPDDVAVVGYDDIDFAAAAAVPLTSVRQPATLLGRTAADLVIAEGAGSRHQHQQVVFTPELVVRESTGHREGRSRAPDGPAWGALLRPVHDLGGRLAAQEPEPAG
ncbi:LacI family DNA-binding transcriptional regulator [Actinoalloteichus spitiensis]|uniref:LacI family DNA-binding transcriptional regulator n=1 Tax=Actinoalloteichus spitiensis TaxID=252394 RepID=UPI0003681308|nr:LacI family DNA-binding transcriptional regulator [Actinoalloteichus spitiensis]